MKKSAKTKSFQTNASATQDIIGLITTLVERLVSLEAKMDTVLSRLQTRPVEPPRQHASPQVSHTQPVNTRPMFKAVCADCGKNCEVPFKPSAGRSVYCKECYSARRKNNSFFVSRADTRLKETQSVYVRQNEKPQAVKPAASAGKKKLAAKKTKKTKKTA